MTTDSSAEKARKWGRRLQSLSRHTLFLTLFTIVSVSVVVSRVEKIRVTAEPQQWTRDTYTLLRNVPEGRTVVIDTAFTNGNRGECGLQMDIVLRMLMREKVRFVVYTWTEPQCAEVARGYIAKINHERRLSGEPEYREWSDYLILGFFADGATMLQTVASNIRGAWGSKTATDPVGSQRNVFDSPVLSGVRKVGDLAAYVTIAPSTTMPTIVARVGRLVPVLSMISGVGFPEQYNYYKSEQLKGLINGLVGAVELETLMAKGIDSQGVVGGSAAGPMIAKPFPGEKNYASATEHYFAFCVAMGFFILIIALGNLGMILEKRGNR